MLRVTASIHHQALRLLRRRPEGGQTLVEYGILVMLIATVTVGVLTLVGADVVQLFTNVSSEFQEIDSRTP